LPVTAKSGFVLGLGTGKRTVSQKLVANCTGVGCATGTPPWGWLGQGGMLNMTELLITVRVAISPASRPAVLTASTM
jgi:hypothetical protein